jgi:HEAT repeat protein
MREHGIVFYATPRDAAEALAREVDAIDAALQRLQAARDTQDHGQGQSAMAALERAIAALQARPDALPALIARAEAAPAPRQVGWLECAARVGGPAAAAPLLQLVGDAARAGALRAAAARALIAADVVLAAPAIGALVREPIAVPELFLLVHALAATGRAEAVAVLIAALQHPDRSVRCHAATGLGNFRSEPGADALAAAVAGDEYPAVRTNALRALPRAAGAERWRSVVERAAGSDVDAAVRAAAKDVLTNAGR